MNPRALRLAVGCLIIVMMTIGCYVCMAVYLLPISQAMDLSIGQVSLLFTFGSLASVITSLVVGKLLQRFPVRLLVAASGVLLTVFFFTIFLSTNIFLIYAGAFLFGIALILSGFTMAQVLITWWFIRNRAKVMSFMNIGLGLFGVIVVPIVANLINVLGLQQTALLQGLIMGGSIVLASIFLLSEHPDTYGLKPVGYADSAVAAAAGTPAPYESQLSVKQLRRFPSFWMILIGSVFVAGAGTGFMNTAAAFYANMGLSAVTASYCISIYNASKLFWSPFYGTLTDRHGPGTASVICGLITAAIFFASPLLSGFAGAVMVAVFVACGSFGGMLGAVSFATVFGTKEAGNLIGYAHAATSLGAMLGAPIAGFLFDATNSYTIYMMLAGTSMLITTVLVGLGTSKKAVQRVKDREIELTELSA